MLIAVVSDTHVPAFRRRLPEALARIAAARPDHILHCGDFTSLDVVTAFERIAPFDGVAGNNDGAEIATRFGRRKIVELDGCRIGLVHGDGERGTTLARAGAAFESEPVDAVFFGHSHVPYCERTAGVLLLNPGSPTDRRRQPDFSFALVEVAGRDLTPRIVRFSP